MNIAMIIVIILLPRGVSKWPSEVVSLAVDSEFAEL